MVFSFPGFPGSFAMVSFPDCFGEEGSGNETTSESRSRIECVSEAGKPGNEARHGDWERGFIYVLDELAGHQNWTLPVPYTLYEAYIVVLLTRS